MSWHERGLFGVRPEREHRDWTDTMQVCERGHIITQFADSQTHSQKRCCPQCGSATLMMCPNCQAKIPGYRHLQGFPSFEALPVPAFCENCGKAYPWTSDELVGADVVTQSATEQVLPIAVVKRTRGYLEQIVNQANGCYEKGWYDACSVMIRKLVEVLLIAVYEAKGMAECVKMEGNFLMLSGLVDDVLSQNTWNLGRETKTALPVLKSLGDRSAHNRHYLCRKADIDKVLPGLRVTVEDLLHHAGLIQSP